LATCVKCWFPGEAFIATDSSEDLAKILLLALTIFRIPRGGRILLDLRGLSQKNLLLTDMPQAIRLVADSASARGADAADNVVVNAEYRWNSGTNSQRTLETRRAYVLQISSALFSWCDGSAAVFSLRRNCAI
jgi:hypothetical protein